MKRLISFLLLIFAVQTAAAWGPKGHDVVAYIAECNVNNRVKAKVMQALGGHTFTYYSSWADNIRNFPEFRHTSTWHYANVDEGYTYATM
ncbi:MAG: S1/P1 Nuclease, partial [Rikenellaceae bacterium]|nr:S1/P1 Nuclease [Rikenellaceae bacterium]